MIDGAFAYQGVHMPIVCAEAAVRDGVCVDDGGEDGDIPCGFSFPQQDIHAAPEFFACFFGGGAFVICFDAVGNVAAEADPDQAGGVAVNVGE